MMDQPYILVLVGPSGCGKTTVGKALEEDYGIKKLVTTTSRPPRPDEKEGRDYYFIEEKDIPTIAFVEKTVYNGYHYGLTQEEIQRALDQYPAVQLAMDQNGAQAMKELYPDQTLVIYFEISEEDMVERMKERGDDELAIQERLNFRRQSREEVSPEQVDLILENKELDQTVQQIMTFIRHL